jgi:hypothetical protein
VAEDARLRHNALPVADGILLDAVVGHFAGSDAGVVLFAGGGQANDVGGGDESADGEEALVLWEEVFEVRHSGLRFDDGGDEAKMKRRWSEGEADGLDESEAVAIKKLIAA